MSRHGASKTTVSPEKRRSPRKIKKNKNSEILMKGKEIIQEPDNPSKKEKVDSIIDERKQNLKKHLHHLKINKTTLAVLTRRHVNMIILQVILMVVQETWTMMIKTKNMKNTLNLRQKKMIEPNKKLVKG